MQQNLSKKELADIIQWDIKNWSKCLAFWDKNASLGPSKKVLALGEREGGMSLYFALKGHEVICSDYNPLPDTTKVMHAEYGVAKKITYQRIDMKAIDLEDESVDVVVFKSVIGALGNKPDQEKALQEIYRVLKPGGVFLFAENLEGSRLHQYLRKKFVSWGERWQYVTFADMTNWNASYTSIKTKPIGVLGLFGRSEKQRKFLAGFDAVLTPITPKKWRYILFGVLKK
jgi:ubiquinone/menaquinone biosynthesis C-methylase UbiE